MAEARIGARVGGVAVVCCVHNVEKRRVIQLVADSAREQVNECPCCQNLYATEPADPVVLCHQCRPRRVA